MFSFFRDRRRRKLLAEPFSPYWESILQRNVGHYRLLSVEHQAKLRDITRVIVAEKTFEGCGGLHITEEIKVTIAAQAGLLLLGIDHEYFDRVRSIIVYPDSFQTPNPDDGYEDDFLSEQEVEGQAVYRGPVIIGWKHVLEEGREVGHGHNVVLHEFAHQLDYLDDCINGTPPLDDKELEARWQRDMTAALEKHREHIDRGEETFFTEHAAENETEFFADATEAFYCDPLELAEEASAVFELLKAYYRLDPRMWFR